MRAAMLSGIPVRQKSLSIPAAAADSTAFHNNGDSFGGLTTLGTNDGFALAFETGGTSRIRLENSAPPELTFLPTAGNSGIINGGTGTNDGLVLRCTSAATNIGSMIRFMAFNGANNEMARLTYGGVIVGSLAVGNNLTSIDDTASIQGRYDVEGTSSIAVHNGGGIGSRSARFIASSPGANISMSVTTDAVGNASSGISTNADGSFTITTNSGGARKLILDSLGTNPIELKVGGAGVAFEVNYSGTAKRIGFYGVTAVVRAAAYTQTYATAARTHDNPTGVDLTDNSTGTASDTIADAGVVYAQANQNDFRASIARAVDRNTADILNMKQLINSLIDDEQAIGIAT